MLQHRGLATAAEVVVSGCSAGGLAAFLHCEHFAERIHAEGLATAKVVCMPDSGLFRDFQGCTTPGVCRAPHYHDRLVWVFDWMNATSGVNDACIAAETPTSNCMFAEHTMKYLKTPVSGVRLSPRRHATMSCAHSRFFSSLLFLLARRSRSKASMTHGRLWPILESSRTNRCQCRQQHQRKPRW